MANIIQDELYKTFLQVSGQQASALADVTTTLSDVRAQVQEMGAAVPVPNARTTASAPSEVTTPRSSVPALAQEIQGASPAPSIKSATSTGTALSDLTMTRSGVLAQAQEIQGAIAAPNNKSTTSTVTSQATSGADTNVPVQQASALSDLTTTLSDVLAQVQERQGAIPAPNVKTTTSTSTSQANSGGDILSSAASTVLKSGFGLAPLVSGLISLFGGSDTPAPAPLVKYALPAAIDFQAAQTASGTTGLDYDQSGRPRVYAAGAAGSMQTMEASGAGSSTSGATPAREAPQITVNVQAMDARSFLDRSNEIALAVRDAMLNMNAINDVVNEL